MNHRFFLVFAFGGLVACGSGAKNDTVQVSGTVSGVTVQSGRAVAVTAQGRAFVSSLDSAGRFHVTVPAGTPFRLVIASAPSAALHPVAGHVVGAANGRWLTAASSIDLGMVRPAAAQPAGTTTKSADAETTSGDQSSDGAGDDHEDDGAGDALCGSGGAGDAELHADRAPDESSGSDDETDKDHEDSVTSKACD